ncbi:MAG: hypothetical protein OJF52_003476 [Nitrospira sp.]|jgi:hypothetical protein|nr:MAG: hypothetical protein OJF52_003476 [Nitrospira sp.]
MSREPVHYDPICHTPVVPERLLLNPRSVGCRITPAGPEWHCDQCGRTFAPDYFDAVPLPSYRQHTVEPALRPLRSRSYPKIRPAWNSSSLPGTRGKNSKPGRGGALAVEKREMWFARRRPADAHSMHRRVRWRSRCSMTDEFQEIGHSGGKICLERKGNSIQTEIVHIGPLRVHRPICFGARSFGWRYQGGRRIRSQNY